MAHLTSEDVRHELTWFAETAMRSQLSDLSTVIQEHIRKELQNISISRQQDKHASLADQPQTLQPVLKVVGPLSGGEADAWKLPPQDPEQAPKGSSALDAKSPQPVTEPSEADKSGSQYPGAISDKPPDAVLSLEVEEAAKAKLAYLRSAFPVDSELADELYETGYYDRSSIKAKPENDEPSTQVPSTREMMLRAETLHILSQTSTSQDYKSGDVSVSRIAGIVKSNRFEHAVLFIICLNALYIGIETNEVARDKDASNDVHFTVFGIIFMVIFASELVLRIYVFRWWFFSWNTPMRRKNANLFWNIFDTFVVGAQVLEYLLALFVSLEDSGLEKLSVLRLLRILRIGRLFRVGKLLRLFGTLRTMVYSISHSWHIFFWALISLWVINYMFAVFITEVASVDLHKEDADPELTQHFGSVSSSMLSMWKACSGGIDWGDLYAPLWKVHRLLAYSFVLFLMFLLIVVMNIFLGIFLDTASSRARKESELQLLKNAQVIFKASDVNASGKITKLDFLDSLSHPDVNQFFNAIDLDVHQAEVLFELLDMSNDGSISTDEFLRGCLRLRGTAKALDLLILSREVTELFDSVAALHKQTVTTSKSQARLSVHLVREHQRLMSVLLHKEPDELGEHGMFSRPALGVSQ